MVAAVRRQEQTRDRDLILAWQIQRIRLETQARKRLPDLKALLRAAGDRQKEPTVHQMRAQLVMLSERLGIPLRKATVKAKVKGE